MRRTNKFKTPVAIDKIKSLAEVNTVNPISCPPTMAKMGSTTIIAIFWAVFGSFALEEAITPRIKARRENKGTRRNKEINH
jgi:hypothetical protein